MSNDKAAKIPGTQLIHYLDIFFSLFFVTFEESVNVTEISIAFVEHFS